VTVPRMIVVPIKGKSTIREGSKLCA
jgi:hypothetical protein